MSTAPNPEYALFLIEEECAEVIQQLMKARRFGLDSVCPSKALSTRQELEKELGDIIASISYSCMRGVFDAQFINECKEAKLRKLLSFVDADGKKLAP